ETRECFVVGHNPAENGRQQTDQRNEVVTQLSPDEHRHHGGENAERESLSEGHEDLSDGGGRKRGRGGEVPEVSMDRWKSISIVCRANASRIVDVTFHQSDRDGLGAALESFLRMMLAIGAAARGGRL